jgi:hypothetical protein
MIIVVEGPSASGKTTWCRAQGRPEILVPEYAPGHDGPDRSDLTASASFWMGVNSDRFRQAEAIERRHGLAICDSDPLKLHYSWCLARIGAGPIDRFRRDVALARDLFTRNRLGMADLILLADPPADELRRRRTEDETRQRHNFELHARLADPLREWYLAIGELDDSDRVRRGFPPDALPPTCHHHARTAAIRTCSPGYSPRYRSPDGCARLSRQRRLEKTADGALKMPKSVRRCAALRLLREVQGEAKGHWTRQPHCHPSAEVSERPAIPPHRQDARDHHPEQARDRTEEDLVQPKGHIASLRVRFSPPDNQDDNHERNHEACEYAPERSQPADASLPATHRVSMHCVIPQGPKR